jgi:ABC-2 type transport system permease protein
VTSLISNEFFKLRTMRSVWLLLAAEQAVVIAGIAGLLVGDGNDPRTAATSRQVVMHVGLVAMFTLLLGVLAVAGEYRHKTITDTYLGTPHRARVVWAKLIAYTVAGVGFGVVAAATAVVVSAIWLSAKGGALYLGDGDVMKTLVGGVIWNGAFAAIGVGVGALVRNLVAAVAVSLGWIGVIEMSVSSLFGVGARWLPFAAGKSLGHFAPDNELLPQWLGGMVLIAYTVLFVLVAVSTTVRRDVT